VSDETPRTVEVPIEREELPPHSMRSWILFGLIGIAVVGMIAIIVTQKIMTSPTRGDVDVDSVVTLQNTSGQWDVIATWSKPAPGGCVVLGWKVLSGDRGYEVASQQMAPPDAAFPAICASPSASIVLEHTQDDPSGTQVVVNGEKFSVEKVPNVDGYTTGRVG
jgi:hypothetical protein